MKIKELLRESKNQVIDREDKNVQSPNKLYAIIISPNIKTILKCDQDAMIEMHGEKHNANIVNVDQDNMTIDFAIDKNLNKILEAEYNGKEVKLNEPEYDYKSESHKFKVYVTHPKTGKVTKVGFGSPDMEIKRDDPDRRKSFRARHKCDKWNFNDHRHTARYWSCRFWEKDKTVSDLVD